MAGPLYANVPTTAFNIGTATCLGMSSVTADASRATCLFHRDQPVMHYCENCNMIMCVNCVTSGSFGSHDRCQVHSLHGDSNPARMCDRLVMKISSEIASFRRQLHELHKNLLAKQHRLMRKKEETTSEIQRYFTTLRERINVKLNEREQQLTEQLNSSVSAQQDAVNEYLEQCESLNHSLQENKSMIENLDQIYKIGRGNSVEHLRKLVDVSAKIAQQRNESPNLEAARDFFLVIRFFIDTAIERTFLNANIACVEVLNSVDGVTGQEPAVASSPSRDETEAPASSQHDPFAAVVAELSSRGGESSLPTATSEPELDRLDEDLLDLEDTATNAQCSSEAGGDTLTVADIRRPQSAPSVSESRVAITTSPSSSSLSGLIDGHASQQTSTADEPPPPYPGLPSSATAREQEDPPPPYPGPPPYTSPGQSRRRSPRPPRPPQPATATPTSSRSQSHLNSARRSEITAPISQESHVRSMRLRGPVQKFPVSEINDKRSCGIVAIMVHKENRLLMIDRWNRKLKYFSETGESYGGLIFREEPWDITRMSSEIFAVTVPKLATIYKVKVNTAEIVTINTLATERKYACVAYHRQNEMFVCGQVPQFGEPIVDVISKNGGPVLVSFRLDMNGVHMFSYPRYVEVANDGTAVVCDWNMKALVFFKLDGNFIGRYKGSSRLPLNDPTGISLDRTNNFVYVVDSKTTSTEGAIHRLSLDGKCTAVVTGQKEFRDARAIVTVDQKLFTGSNKGIVNCFVAERSSTDVGFVSAV